MATKQTKQPQQPQQPQPLSSSTSRGSSSEASESQTQQAVAQLPVMKRPVGRPPGSKTKPREVVEGAAKVVDAKPVKRKLPEDRAEADKELGLYKMMAAPVVGAVSSTFELLETRPLNPKEVEGGEFAIGALLYQEGAHLDAKLLCMLWAMSISSPRLAEMALKKRKADSAKLKPASGGAQLQAMREAVADAGGARVPAPVQTVRPVTDGAVVS